MPSLSLCYLFSWETRPRRPHICSQSLRSDQKRQDMTSSVTPRPEEVLQKKMRVHRGKTCTRDEVTLWPLMESMLQFCFSFMMNMCPKTSKCWFCLFCAAVKEHPDVDLHRKTTKIAPSFSLHIREIVSMCFLVCLPQNKVELIRLIHAFHM